MTTKRAAVTQKQIGVCRCVVTRAANSRNNAGTPHIDYCPMHAAADRLLEVVRAVVGVFSYQNGRMYSDAPRYAQRARAALAYAEGKEEA